MLFFLKAFFGKKRIRAIEGNEILMRKYIEKRKAEIEAKQIASGRDPSELSYTTINCESALLRSMFNLPIKSSA